MNYPHVNTRIHAHTARASIHTAVEDENTRHARLVGQEVGDPYGAAEAVRDATFVDESQPRARVSQSPLGGKTYS